MLLLRNTDLTFLKDCGISPQPLPQPAAAAAAKEEPPVSRATYRETAEMAVYYEGESWRRGQQIRGLHQLIVWQWIVMALLGVWVVLLVAAQAQHPGSVERPPSSLSSDGAAPRIVKRQER